MDKEYWLCCGSTEFFKHMDGCCEAQIGHPEHCRWGTADQHSLWQIKSTPQTKPLSDDEILDMSDDYIANQFELAFEGDKLVEYVRAVMKRAGQR